MQKKILITGGSGLVGSHLINKLLEIGDYELFITVRSGKDQLQKDNCNKIIIDLATDWDINKLPKDLFAIVHLSQADNFRDFPNKASEIFYINTLSTQKLIDFASKNKVTHFIYASSGGVYGNDGIFAEDQEAAYKKEMGFYIGTKYCSEVILKNYFDDLSVKIIRFFFVYGNNQKRTMLIPRLIDRVKNEEPISLQGTSGMSINPVHATDAAKAIIACLEIQGSSIINVAGPQVLTLKDVGEIIGEALNKEPQFIIDENMGSTKLVGEITKMAALIQEPLISFKEGIKTMI